MSTALVKEPIYQQLHQLLRSLATSEEFPAGAKFLTEREISERYGVSRATANKALSNLVSAGVLEFRKGVGTFTRGCRMDYNLRSLVSFTEEAAAAGKRATTKLIGYGRMRPEELPEDVAKALKPAADTVVLYMERLRLADERPVIFERRWVSLAASPELTLDDMSGSLFAAWNTKYELLIEGSSQNIRAVNANAREASLLEVQEGAASLLVTCTGYLAQHVPLWFEHTLYRGDSYEFHNEHGAIQQGAPPAGHFLGLA